ncbi:Phage antirepressor protein KilAC domain protein [Prolinoborus fasciculus]|uniref:phage antirepressor KilAC domain-containing protein n=1 Tax=Acinetobacter sp. USHLN143 TaxID=3081679 RepID=UPI000D613096|nr:phage antirepressor KilAC domain-containing protein [Prolinoborus fasciculus]SPJ21258.1 Phage antirepressor protein KilAC domain protein [Prolinoborus fasciculus]
MNMLTQGNFNTNEVTMSSLEIVDFINEYRAKNESNPVQLRHADFMAKVPKVLGDKGLRNFSDTYIHHQNGQTYPCFKLPKREACLMAMSYSYELQAQVFDRMTAMEEALKAKNSFDITNPAHLLQAIEVQAKLNIELTQKVAVLEPKAKGLDRIADCTNVLGIRESAKVLKVGQNQLVQYLIDHKVVYRDQHGKIQAYQKSVDQKLIHVVTSAPRLFESGEKVFTQVKLTQKLITRIAKWLEQGVAA